MNNSGATKDTKCAQIRPMKWSNIAKLDQPLDREVDCLKCQETTVSRISALALNDALAFAELADVRVHHLALAMAVIELTQDAGVRALWTVDDPTVALLRAAAKLARTNPQAMSGAAAGLAHRLAGANPN